MRSIGAIKSRAPQVNHAQEVSASALQSSKEPNIRTNVPRRTEGHSICDDGAYKPANFEYEPKQNDLNLLRQIHESSNRSNAMNSIEVSNYDEMKSEIESHRRTVRYLCSSSELWKGKCDDNYMNSER